MTRRAELVAVPGDDLYAFQAQFSAANSARADADDDEPDDVHEGTELVSAGSALIAGAVAFITMYPAWVAIAGFWGLLATAAFAFGIAFVTYAFAYGPATAVMRGMLR